MHHVQLFGEPKKTTQWISASNEKGIEEIHIMTIYDVNVHDVMYNVHIVKSPLIQTYLEINQHG